MMQWQFAEGIATDGVYRAAALMAERERWIHTAQALGVSAAEAASYDAAIIRYAQTVMGSNTEIWRQLWSNAIGSLMRGDGLPVIPA